MKVLITGGAGFIGSHIAEKLFQNGHEILIVDNLSTGSMENLKNIPNAENLITVEDIINRDRLEKIFSEFQPEVVCHQAAQPSLLTSWKSPSIDANINILGSLYLMELSKCYAVRQFVFVSTSAVFSLGAGKPNEDVTTNPFCPYGIAKATVERYLERWYRIPYTIIRYGNVYGPRQVAIGENQLIARIFDHIYNGKIFGIYGDGSHSRDYIFVEDIANANLNVIENCKTGIYHAGWGRATSVNAVVQSVCDLTGYDFDLIQHFAAKQDEPVTIALDTRYKIFDHKVLLLEGLKRTNDFWKEKIQC